MAVVTLEDHGEGADGRQIASAFVEEKLAQFAGTPAGETAVGLNNEFFEAITRPAGGSGGSSGSIFKAAHSEQTVTFNPFVGSGRTDAEAPAQFTDVSLRMRGELDEFQTFHRDGDVVPWHSPPACRGQLSCVHHVSEHLSTMCPVRTSSASPFDKPPRGRL